jgi:hypothetical protein
VAQRGERAVPKILVATPEDIGAEIDLGGMYVR